jgi:hypothetical protein
MESCWQWVTIKMVFIKFEKFAKEKKTKVPNVPPRRISGSHLA